MDPIANFNHCQDLALSRSGEYDHHDSLQPAKIRSWVDDIWIARNWNMEEDSLGLGRRTVTRSVATSSGHFRKLHIVYLVDTLSANIFLHCCFFSRRVASMPRFVALWIENLTPARHLRRSGIHKTKQPRPQRIRHLRSRPGMAICCRQLIWSCRFCPLLSYTSIANAICWKLANFG